MTYAELVQLVQDYMENAETTFVADIPTFVRQAEERIYREVMLPELRKTATLSLSASDQYVDRPADFIAPFSMAVIDGSGDYTYLLRKDVNFIREAYPGPTTEGLPKYYAQYSGDTSSSDGVFIFGPTPDAAYSAELHYYYDPESIVTASTTWLGDNAETALLYGTLVEAYVFQKGDVDMMAEYKARYASAMADLKTISERAGRDDYRNGRQM